MTRRPVKRPTTKHIMPRTESESWPSKKDIVQRTSKFSKPVEKDGMKLTRNDSPAAREPIVNKPRSTLKITEDNTVETTGNESTNIGEVIMPRIRKGSGKDFMTKSKENWARTSCVFEPGTKSLPTLCGIPTVKVLNCKQFSLWSSCYCYSINVIKTQTLGFV